MKAATIFLLTLSSLASSAWAQTDEEDDEKKKTTVPAGLKYYMGRQIALTMSYKGAPWLIRARREREERCSLMLANLGIKRGMKICDMGCGNGFYSLKMAKMTGSKGQIYGVDIQPQMLYLLRTRMEEQGVNNISPVLGSVHDPRLPPGAIDLILLVDVYHEFSHPQQMLAAMRRSLSPTGRIALLEYREEDPDVPIKPLHKMSKKQILKEFPGNGFKLVKEFEGLPWQHMMFFAKDENWKPPQTESDSKDATTKDAEKANSDKSKSKREDGDN